MARFKQGSDPKQGFLFPPSLRDWLPPDHLAWFVRDAVEHLDLDELTDRYRICGKGELAYEPRMMLRVLLCGYATGLFSSRQIAKQVEENIAFRVLADKQAPSHRSTCRFRAVHIDLFPDLFVQVVRLAHEAGLAHLGSLSIDGSKIKANASKHKAMSYAYMEEAIERLQGEIDEILRIAEDADAAEDHELGPDFRNDRLPKELADREKRLEQVRLAKKRLEARKAQEAAEKDEKRAAKAKEEGKPPPKERPGGRKHPKGKPQPKDQENFTDPDSRIMKVSSGGFEQCYNAQVAATEGTQIVVAVDVDNCAADCDQLVPMAAAVMENTGEAVDRVLADAGYCSNANIKILEEAGIDAYIATGREGKSKSEAKSPEIQRMTKKLKTKTGRKCYRKGKHRVDPVFGWLKSMLGFRAFSLRGLDNVRGEFNLDCLALNLRRLQKLMV